MRISLSFFLFFLFSTISVDLLAQCTPSTTEGSCGSAQTLTVGDPCINGTTCAGGAEDPAASCLYAGSECSWYSFTASASDMFVEIDVSYTGGCHISSSIFSGSCGSLTEISCESGAPLSDLHSLTGLTVGNTYYVQVCYAPGGPCGKDDVAEYCIRTGEPDPPCEVCSNPCGTASGFDSAPTSDEVVDSCETAPFSPELQSSSTHTFCYSFSATSTSVDFNVIITSNCGGGNVTNFSWNLYNYPACGGAIQSGDLSSLTFSGLTVGNDYVFCYEFTVPSTCTHSQHCPYFVGAQPLPISLLQFNAKPIDNDKVQLDWSTASEENNDFFTIERSKNGTSYEAVDKIDGAGNSSSTLYYQTEDEDPYNGTSYYRLKQTDFDGQSSYSNPVAVNIDHDLDEITFFPGEERGRLTFHSSTSDQVKIQVYDVSGRVMIAENFTSNPGTNTFFLNTNTLKKGVYYLRVEHNKGNSILNFIK